MLKSLITSKTRMKLLIKFFINPETTSYLRELAEEFGESSNAVRVELNRLVEAGLLTSEYAGRLKLYKANVNNPIFSELHNIVKKYIGIDKLIENIVNKLENVEISLITGDYARGIDSGIIDLIIVGEINRNYLQSLVEKTEFQINRKIRTIVFTLDEFEKYKSKLKKTSYLVV